MFIIFYNMAKINKWLDLEKARMKMQKICYSIVILFENK